MEEDLWDGLKGRIYSHRSNVQTLLHAAGRRSTADTPIAWFSFLPSLSLSLNSRRLKLLLLPIGLNL
jgi:hypothetical protein